MILVFDMVLSLWASINGGNFKTASFRSYSRTRPQRREIFKQRMAQRLAYWPLGGISDGPVNAATNFRMAGRCRDHWLCNLLVADGTPGRVSGYRTGPYAKPG
jgi:hypothetical protein